jgi:hypothetical protein
MTTEPKPVKPSTLMQGRQEIGVPNSSISILKLLNENLRLIHINGLHEIRRMCEENVDSFELPVIS